MGVSPHINMFDNLLPHNIYHFTGVGNVLLNILFLMPPHFVAKKKLIVNVHLKKRNIHKRKNIA